MHGVNEKRVMNFSPKETLRRMAGKVERNWEGDTIKEQSIRIWTGLTMLSIALNVEGCE